MAGQARRWIVRVVVKGQKNRKGGPLRTDFGLGSAELVPLNQARERALEYRRMAKQGLASGLGDRNDLRDCAERVVSGQGGRGGPPPTRMTGMIVRHLGLHLRRVGGCGYRRRKR